MPTGRDEHSLPGREQHRQRQADSWPDRGDAKVRSRGVRLTLELGDASEREQSDGPHLHAIVSGHDTMRHLVSQQTGEQHHGHDEAGDPIGHVRVPRAGGEHVESRPPREVGEDHRDAPVYADRYSVEGA